MRVIYLHQALLDMNWVRKYYDNIFPAGRNNARAQLQKTEKLISENPLVGHPSEAMHNAREFHISRTPFSFIYRVTTEHIEILRVIDNRSDWSQ